MLLPGQFGGAFDIVTGAKLGRSQNKNEKQRKRRKSQAVEPPPFDGTVVSRHLAPRQQRAALNTPAMSVMALVRDRFSRVHAMNADAIAFDRCTNRQGARARR